MTGLPARGSRTLPGQSSGTDATLRRMAVTFMSTCLYNSSDLSLCYAVSNSYAFETNSDSDSITYDNWRSVNSGVTPSQKT